MSKDLFAPVSQDEIDSLYAPVTEQELGQQPVIDTPSQTGAFLRSVGQGASFGFSDEAIAAARALHPDMTYDQAVAEERAKLHADEQTHPGTVLSGEIAGGFIPAIAAAPLAAASGLTKLAKGASLAGKIGAGALEGAATGALYGAGKSEDDVSSDALSGAKIGGAIGGTIPIIGRGLGKASEWAKSKSAPEFLNDIMKSFEFGKKGQGLISAGNVEGIENKTQKLAKDTTEQISNELGNLSSVKNYLLNNSKKTIDVSNLMQSSINDLSQLPNTQMLISKIQNLQSLYGTNIPLKEANEIAKLLRQNSTLNAAQKQPGKEVFDSLVKDITDKYTKQIDSTEATNLLKNAPDEIKSIYDSFNNRPRVSKVESKDLQLFGKNAGTGETYDVSELPLKDINENISHYLNASEILGNVHKLRTPLEKTQATEKISKYIRGIEKSSDSGEKYRNYMQDALTEMRKANPLIADQMEKKIKDQASLHNLSRTARGVKQEFGEGVSSGKGLISGVVGDIKGMLGVAPANIVGQTFKMSSALSKKPELFLEKALTRFPKDSVIHSMLQQAISSPNENKKRAIMNTLMQQSAFRNMLKEEDNGEATR